MASLRLATVLRHLQGGNLAPNQTSSGTEQFQYTLDNPKLSLEQRTFYEENGYLVVRRLVDDALLDMCGRYFAELCEGRIDKGNMLMMKEVSLAKTDAKGEHLYYKVADFADDEVLSQYIFNKKLLDYVECFVGPNIKAINSMLVNKPPDSGKRTSIHPLHQDLHFFPQRPADRIVASWTAMESVNVDNGCLVVIPGSHKGPLMHHGYPELGNGVNKAYHEIQGYTYNTPVLHLPMEKGDTIFFHPLLIHGSGVNTTKGFRKAIACHFIASECYYIDDVQGTSQESVAKEIEGIAKHRGLDLSFQDFWRFYSRLVRGEEVTL